MTITEPEVTAEQIPIDKTAKTGYNKNTSPALGRGVYVKKHVFPER